MNKSLLAAAMLAAGSSSALAAENWPRVREFEISVGIDWTADRIDLDVPIYDEKGIVVYRFICRGGNEAREEKLFAIKGILYIGNLMCILNQGNDETEASLLVETSGGPWHSRGQFWREHLFGTCGRYPEYGRVRNFRLRKMHLTLDLSDTTEAGDTVTYSMMKITVKRGNSSAAFAEHSGYVDPQSLGHSCENVEVEKKENMKPYAPRDYSKP